MTQVIQTATNVVNIPLSLVVANAKMNSRSVMDSDTIEELAKSIKNDGQLMPVRVEKRQDGKFDLVYGFRRYAAIKMLAESNKDAKSEYTIRAEVSEKMEAVDRKVANIAENIARENLTTYDQAVAFLDLKKEHDLSGQKIANSVGKSVPYINNLVRIMEGIDESIRKRWETECQPSFGIDKETEKKLPNVRAVCTMDWLTKLVAKTPKAEQFMELQRALGLVDDDEEEEGDDETGRSPQQPGAPKRATMVHLTKALEAAEKAKKEAKGEEAVRIGGVIQALKFAIGKAKSIKEVYTMPKQDGSDE